MHSNPTEFIRMEKAILKKPTAKSMDHRNNKERNQRDRGKNVYMVLLRRVNAPLKKSKREGRVGRAGEPEKAWGGGSQKKGEKSMGNLNKWDRATSSINT